MAGDNPATGIPPFDRITIIWPGELPKARPLTRILIPGVPVPETIPLTPGNNGVPSLWLDIGKPGLISPVPTADIILEPPKNGGLKPLIKPGLLPPTNVLPLVSPDAAPGEKDPLPCCQTPV